MTDCRRGNMRRATGIGLTSLCLAFAFLLGCAGDTARATEPTVGEPACTGGQIAAAGKCVPANEAIEKIDAIVRAAMAKHALKAVLAGVTIGDQPLVIRAWGESMTGVPASP